MQRLRWQQTIATTPNLSSIFLRLDRLLFKLCPFSSPFFSQWEKSLVRSSVNEKSLQWESNWVTSKSFKQIPKKSRSFSQKSLWYQHPIVGSIPYFCWNVRRFFAHRLPDDGVVYCGFCNESRSCWLHLHGVSSWRNSK